MTLSKGALDIAGVAVVVLHASFRVPNLKTRLASARDDFRAVWCATTCMHGKILASWTARLMHENCPQR